MLLLPVLLAAFLLIFVTEMGDKTQLVAVTLASRHDPKTVFFAVWGAMTLLTIFAVVVGAVLFSFIPVFWVRLAAALLFVGFGVWTLKFGDDDDDDDLEEPEEGNGGGKGKGKDKDKDKDKGVFAKAFTMTFMAEMGDKTQVAAIALTASTAAPLEVFLGAALGFAVVTALGVWVGKKLGEKLDKEMLEKAGGVLFVVIGAAMLLEMFVL